MESAPTKKVHSVFHVWEDDEHELMLKELEWHYFELPKLGKKLNKDDEGGYGIRPYKNWGAVCAASY